jgi:hypothetical protein
MENKDLRNKFVLALSPILVLCLIVFMNTASVSSSFETDDENAAPVSNVYDAEEQKADVHEPVYVSIFKLIMNCNPFQKEAQL